MLPGKLYVWRLGCLPFTSCLAGPFDSEAEAIAAAGALEADQPEHRTQTEIWLCPADELRDDGPAIPPPTMPWCSSTQI